MPLSTLTLDYVELMIDVAYFLYGKTDIESLSTAQQNLCDEAVQTGYRQFLYPPAAEGIQAGYEWTFMRPVANITTSADDADQDMPEDFGRLIGDGFTFAANAQVPPVLADVGEGKIRNLRLQMSETGRPRVAGFRRKTIDGVAGQLWEVMWYPTPDDAYEVTYRYEALVDALTSAAPQPLGGIKYAETLRASCIAAAAARVNSNRGGDEFVDFIRILASSIERDKAESAKFFGNVGTHGEYENHSAGGSETHRDNYTMSVGGTQIYPST